jgi:hypothetical protein
MNAKAVLAKRKKVSRSELCHMFPRTVWAFILQEVINVATRRFESIQHRTLVKSAAERYTISL